MVRCVPQLHVGAPFLMGRAIARTSVLRSKTLARAESARAGQVPREIPLRQQGGELHPRTVGNAEF